MQDDGEAFKPRARVNGGRGQWFEFVLAGRGLDISSHRSRTMSRQLLAEADLVVGMAREHVREAVLAVPDLWARAFTLKELVRRITGELGAKPTVVVTGGLSALPWARDIPGVAAIDPLLTLRGLALLKRELMAHPKMARSPS